MRYDRQAHMAECTRAVRYDELTREFVFDQQRLSIRRLGAIIAEAKLSGENTTIMPCVHRSWSWTTSYSVRLHVDYLLEMLEFVAEHGWFWDEIEEHSHRRESDHEHDWQHITPGLYWAEVKRLRQDAHDLSTSASRHAELDEPEIAEQLMTIGQAEVALADRLLPLSIPDYRKEAKRRRR